MNCSICGTQIPMGQPNCPNCGNVVQPMVQPMQPMQPMQSMQPMQPMGGYQQPTQPTQPMGGYQQPTQPTQPMGGYQQAAQPTQPMGGYQQAAQPVGTTPKASNMMNLGGVAGMIDGGIMKIVAMIGALLIAISPLLPWCSVKVEFWGYEEKEAINMFGIAKGEEGVKIFVLLALLLLVIGVQFILWELTDKLPQIVGIKAKLEAVPFYELINLGVVLLVFIVAMTNGTVNDAIDAADALGKGSHGIGPVFCFIGLILAAAPRVFKMLNIKIG